MLVKYAQDEAEKLNYKKINVNLLFLALASDISPQTKLTIEKFGLTQNKLLNFLKENKKRLSRRI